MRHYAARPPVAPLADVVEYVWASSGASAHARERVVPTGTLELVISLVDDRAGDPRAPRARLYDADGRDQTLSATMVSGAYRRPFTFDTLEYASVVGAHLRAGHAAAVLGVPPSELVDRHVDLEALWGRRARLLRERLCEARTTEHRFQILETELVSRRHEQRVRPEVAYALDELARPTVRVAQIAKNAGTSQRRLIEQFMTAVGMTPKRYGRILRYHRAAALARTSRLEWARVAHECGYYDQAHLIRDFRELANVTPSDLLRASTHEKEHHQLAVLDP